MYSASDDEDIPQAAPQQRRQLKQLEGEPISDVSDDEPRAPPPSRKRKFIYDEPPQRKKQKVPKQTQQAPRRKRKEVEEEVEYEEVKNDKIEMLEYTIPNFKFDETHTTHITPRTDMDYKYMHDSVIKAGYNFTTTESGVTMTGDVVVHCIFSIWSQEATSQYTFSPEEATDVATLEELIETFKDGMIESGPLPKMKRSKFSQLLSVLAQEFMKVGNKACMNTRFQEFITKSSQDIPFTPGSSGGKVDCVTVLPFVLRPVKPSSKAFDAFAPHRFNSIQTAGFVSADGTPQRVVLWPSANREMLRIGGKGNGSGIMFFSGFKSWLAKINEAEEVRIKGFVFAILYNK